MANVTVITPTKLRSCQVEVPEGCERSVEGALHLRPGTTYELTRDEAEFLASEGYTLLQVDRTPSEALKAALKPKTVRASGGSASKSKASKKKATAKDTSESSES